MSITTQGDGLTTISVDPEALAAGTYARRACAGLDAAQSQGGEARSLAAGALDPASRAVLAELVQAWGILGSQLASTSGALASSLAASAERYHAAERALSGALARSRP